MQGAGHSPRQAAGSAAPAAGSLATMVRRLPAETRLAALFTLLSFFAIGLPRVFTNTAAFTLFLQTYGAGALPYTYIATAIAVPAIGYAYLRLEPRLPFATLMLLTLFVDMGVLAAARLGLGLDGLAWPIFAVTVWVEVEWVLTGLVFWGLAERSFDIRQAKRLFGIIGAGGPVAVVIGGLAVPALLAAMGTADLLWLSLGSVAIAAALVAYLTRSSSEHVAEDHEESAEDAGSRGLLAGNRKYLYLILSISVMSMFLH